MLIEKENYRKEDKMYTQKNDKLVTEEFKWNLLIFASMVLDA